MKNQFKILVLVLITSLLSYGQQHEIIRKTIDADKETSLLLNLENLYVAIEESTDGKIHLDYSIQFEGYSKKEIQKTLDEIVTEVASFDNYVTLKAKSQSQITFSRFQLNSDHGLYIEGDFFNKKKDTVIQKTKVALLQEIKKNNRSEQSSNPLEYLNGRFKKIDKDGNLSNIRKGNMDIMRSQFVIKVPPVVKLNINAINSGVHFRNDMSNEFSATITKGTLKAKGLLNAYNSVRIDDANFEAETVSGGVYNFKNAKHTKIGSIRKAKINSEFSKIEIGEIDLDTAITDFSSEYWLYNWSNDFDRFQLFSEYSKVYLFYPKLNHSLKVIGNNTKCFVGHSKFEISMQPSRDGEKFNMMSKAPEPDKKLSGRLFFDIVHGIIYLHGDEMKIINK